MQGLVRILRVYTFVDSDEEQVEKDLSRIEELIKQRALEKPSVTYHVLTSISHRDVETLLIIEASSEDESLREREFVYSLLKSSCKALDFELVDDESLTRRVAEGLRNFFYADGDQG